MKNTKKILMGFMMSVMFLISMFSALALDVNDNQLNENNKNEMREAKMFETNHGSTVRMLQLQKNILKNIEDGEYILENSEIENVEELNDALDQLQVIYNTIEDIKFNDNKEALQMFLDYKNEANELSNHFKNKLSERLSEEEKINLREKVKEQKSEKVKEVEANIEKNKKEYNAEKTQNMLKEMNSKNTELVNKIRNGELTGTDIKNEIKNEFQKMNSEDKDKAIKLLKSMSETKSKENNKIYSELNEDREQRIKQVKNQVKQIAEDNKEQLRVSSKAKVNAKNTSMNYDNETGNKAFDETSKGKENSKGTI